MGAGVPLTKALASLRAELREAVEAGEGDDLKLRVEGLEVELSLEISGEANAEVSGSFWTVLTAKGRYAVASASCASGDVDAQA